MHCIMRLFWRSAAYSFFFHAVYIPGHCNVPASHAFHLDDAAHCIAFLKFLYGGFVSAASSLSCPALPHMLPVTYAYLLGNYYVLG